MSSEESATTNIFCEKGRHRDEVVLQFDDGKQLFVSKAFLEMASSVFEAMFTGDYKEKKENKVDFPGKNYDDVLELLQCIHPRTLKPVDKVNVFQVLPLANEYLIESLAKTCREFMVKWLNEEIRAARDRFEKETPVKICLDILNFAIKHNLNDICRHAAEVIAKFPHHHYVQCLHVPSNENDKSAIALFETLPIEWKYTILLYRITRINDMNMMVY